MIVYGWNTKIIKQAPLPDHECPQCHQKQSALVIVAQYVHIFWIPVFPYKKTATIVCSNCKHQTEEKAITLGNNVSVTQLKAAVPIPKYLFVGLALIIAGIGYLIYDIGQESKLKAAFVENPQVGDVYLIKNNKDTSQYNHFLMKVRDVKDDSLWVSYSSFNYNGIITKLDPKDGFYDIMFAIHKSGIKEYHDSGELLKVMRDYSAEDTGFDREIEFIQPDSVETN